MTGMTEADKAAESEEVARLRVENDRLRKALEACADAADEFYRYQYGGEMRGSYDGRPERECVFSAGRKARAALAASSTLQN